MSIVTATAAQRAELQAALAQCGKDLHHFSERGNTPSTDEAAELAATIARAQAALAAAGYSSVPTGSAVVANSGTVAVRNSAGADSHNATAVVTGTTLTGVNLAATVALVDNGDTTTATGTGTTATLVVANGVVTGVTLA